MRNIFIIAIIACITQFANAQNNYIKYANLAYNTISGVNQNLLSVDVYKPTLYSGNRPVMIYIHGGYWFGGDKNNVGFKDNYFTDSGYVFVSINYRLSPDPVDTLSPTAVRFPIHPQDCADAIKWVFDNISTYSGDTNKVSLIGHSAGAHLVLLLSTNHSFLQNAGVNPSSIKCACSLDCGMFDLFYELAQAGNNIQRRAPLINAFGTDPALYDDASPIFHVEQGKYLPYIQLVHQGTTNQITSNYMFRDSMLANNHTNVFTFNAFPYPHEIINQGLGSSLDSIGMNTAVMQFFGNCLASNVATGIDDIDTKLFNLSIYPNPSNNTIFADCPKGYQIYSITGQILKQSNQTTSQINISDLPTGLYILKTDNKVGRFIKTD